jgi:hypothetical protein
MGVAPLGVLTRVRSRGSHLVALDPLLDVVPVELLGPQQPRVGPPRHVPIGIGEVRTDHCAVELVRLRTTVSGDRVESRTERLLVRPMGRQAQSYRFGCARGDVVEPIPECSLRPGLLGVHRTLFAVDDVSADAVLGVLREVVLPPQGLGIGFVVAEQH